MGRHVKPHATGDYLCKCGKLGIKQAKRDCCTTCFNEYMRAYQLKYYHKNYSVNCEEKIPTPVNSWDENIASRMLSRPLIEQGFTI